MNSHVKNNDRILTNHNANIIFMQEWIIYMNGFFHLKPLPYRNVNNVFVIDQLTNCHSNEMFYGRT